MTRMNAVVAADDSVLRFRVPKIRNQVSLDPKLIERLPWQFRLERFRGFHDSGWFQFSPLTCLVGRNSSGKSSIMSALLVLKQSVEQGSMGGVLSPLTLSGAYCDLGNYADVVHRHRESDEIVFSFSVPFAKLHPTKFGPPIVSVDRPLSQRAVPSGYFWGMSSSALPMNGSVTARLGFTSNEPFGPSLSRLEVIADGIGSAKLVRTASESRRSHWRIYTSSFPANAVALSQIPRAFFPIVEVRRASYIRSNSRTKRRIRQFVEAIRYLFRFLTRTLTDSELIGPFRTPPERRYAFGGFASSRKDPSGDHAVDVLITESLLRREKENRPLSAALSFWIKHLRLAKSLDVRDIAKKMNLFQLDVRGAGFGSRSNMVDVGFGISQVLPVLVQGLLTRPGGMFWVQQPEIHLHPDAQAGLADFFIFLAAAGVSPVVETHSEYLLLRLRRRLAEKSAPVHPPVGEDGPRYDSLTVNDITVLLSDAAPTGGSSVQQLEMGSSFQFTNLPRGFMSQALEDRMALLEATAKSNA